MTDFPDPDHYSDRQGDRAATAAFLTSHGFHVTEGTLRKHAVTGDGPPYRLWGRRPLYNFGKCLQWAIGRLSPEVRSTSEYVPEAKSQRGRAKRDRRAAA